MLYLIRGNDFKAKKWKEAAPEGVNIHLIKGSRISFGLKVFKKTIKLKAREVVVIQRYLNDYPSLLKSILLLCTEICLLFYLKLRGIKFYWVCHNINRESHENFPAILRIRRKLTIRDARKILVLDPILVKYAKEKFHDFRGEILPISFGEYERNVSIHSTKEAGEKKMLNGPNAFRSLSWTDLLTSIKSFRPQNGYLGFCAGSVLEKKKYLENIPKLIEAAKKQGKNLKLLVVSDLREIENQELHQFLVSAPEIFFVNSLVSLDLSELAHHIDFYWTGYDDWSMPYSVYTAVSTSTPTITMNIGVLPRVMEEYEIGLTLSENFENLNFCLEQLNEKRFAYTSFLGTHKWENFGIIIQ
ncbi:MAG: hypothetical protein R8G66_13040 [Cytophagales bacterium]|nr:hypothetical protein [Cytophagales bacterium]